MVLENRSEDKYVTLTYNKVKNIMKVLFSAVLFQLFLIILYAETGELSPIDVNELLEYPAVSCALIQGGGLLLEYLLKTEKGD